MSLVRVWELEDFSRSVIRSYSEAASSSSDLQSSILPSISLMASLKSFSSPTTILVATPTRFPRVDAVICSAAQTLPPRIAPILPDTFIDMPAVTLQFSMALVFMFPSTTMSVCSRNFAVRLPPHLIFPMPDPCIPFLRIMSLPAIRFAIST